MSKPKRRANRLTQLELTELSLVDNPANQGARVSLYKRDATDDNNSSLLLKQLTDFIQSLVSGKNKSSGSEDPSNQPTPGDKTMSDKNKDNGTDVAELTKSVGTLTQTVTDLQKQLKLEQAKNALSASEREYFTALKAEEGTKFLEAENKAEFMKNHPLKNDKEPVLQDLIKRAVEDAVKPLQDKLKSTETALEAEQTLRKTAEFEKRASELYPNLPGTPAEKGAMLKNIESITDEAVRKNMLANLATQNALLKSAFSNVGTTAGGNVTEGSPLAKLEKLAKDKAAADKTTYEKAYTEVMQTEVGKQLYSEYEEQKRSAN